MNAHSLKSRQLLAALRTLPECRPHNVNGVSAYVEAADKVEELERAITVLRENMVTALGTVALAVQQTWKRNQIPPSTRLLLGIHEPPPTRPEYPMWVRQHGWHYEVPAPIAFLPGTTDESYSHDTAPKFRAAGPAYIGVSLMLWCEHPDPELREPKGTPRFQCILEDEDVLWEENDPARALALWKATVAAPIDWPGLATNRRSDIPDVVKRIRNLAGV